MENDKKLVEICKVMGVTMEELGRALDTYKRKINEANQLRNFTAEKAGNSLKYVLSKMSR